ncbi:MAG: MerR family transcriptional regulator [Bacteroidetes bacterium 4572_128]|nr:MAG: MerR family transcriptional regulator [Bacteroidetes bacterium 4572_128]
MESKLKYSIGEVAKIFNVNISLIRYWENKFEIIKPIRNKKGNRTFTKNDIKNFRLIYFLVKEKGMTLKGANKKIKENKDENFKIFEIIEKLQKIKKKLLEIKKEI